MRAVYLTAVVAGLAKILFEGWTGISIFTDPDALGGRPLVLAHALGSLAGCVALGVGAHDPQGQSGQPGKLGEPVCSRA